jgi:hypothetical protein
MRFSTLALTLLPLLARADFTMWSGSCATGEGEGDGFGSTSIATDAQGACGGCATEGEAGEDSPFDGGNPCAASCADDTLIFTLNGENYDITTSDGTNVGSCARPLAPPTSRPAPLPSTRAPRSTSIDVSLHTAAKLVRVKGWLANVRWWLLARGVMETA